MPLAVRVPEHDYAELQLLSSDAQHAKEVALAELEKVKAAARVEKETRAKALREKQVRVCMFMFVCVFVCARTVRPLTVTGAGLDELALLFYALSRVTCVRGSTPVR